MTEPRPVFWLRAGFWRWTARLLVAGVLLLLTLTTWVLVSPPSLEPVREDLQGWLSSKLERPIAFQDLTWTWRGGLKVRVAGVEVGHRDLSAEEVRLGVAAVPLLWGEVRFQGLELAGLRLVLERGDEGRLYAGGFYVDPERNVTFPFLARFRHFRIDGGTLVWRDHQGDRDVELTLRDWEVTLVREGDDHRLALTGETGGGTVNVQGRLDGFGRGPSGWRLHGTVRGSRVPVAPVAAYLGTGPRRGLGGRADLRAEVEGGWPGPLTVDGRLQWREGTVTWPGPLTRPMDGLALETGLRWERKEGRSTLSFGDLRLERGGLVLDGSGTLEWGGRVGAPRVDARAHLQEAAVADLRPLAQEVRLPGKLAQWLRDALPAGRVEGARLRLRGPLPRFPFPEGEGRFRVEADVAGVRLAYHPEWPAVEDLAGTLVLERQRLAFRAEGGRILGSPLGELRFSIHDLMADPPELRLQGGMDLALRDGIRFLEASPLQEKGFLGPAVLRGPAHLELDLALPLAREAKPEVVGRLDMRGGRFRARPDLPPLEGITGAIGFSGKTLRGRDLTGRLLGQAVALQLDRREETPFAAEVRGRFPAEVIRRELARRGLPFSLEHRLNGELQGELIVELGESAPRFRLRADLRELAVVFPEPVFKGHGEPASLVVEGDLSHGLALEGRLEKGDDQWRLRYRDGADPSLGVGVGCGQAAPEPRPGHLRLAGRIPRLPLRQWVRLVSELPAAAGSDRPLSHLAADLELGEVRWGRRSWGGGRLLVRGNPAAGEAGYRVRGAYRSERLAGEAIWTEGADGRPELTANLDWLRLPATEQWSDLGIPGQGDSGALPSLDLLLTAKELIVGERALKNARIQAQSDPERLLLHGVRAEMGRSDLRLQGDWLADRARTRIRLDVATRDFGAWLRDVGVYPSMKGGKGSFGGTLSWPGRPREFDAARLDGSLRLRMVEGEIERFYFLSKALATLNILDWPRQLARGMKDMASGGLVYRELEGETRIRDGVARADNWVLESAPLRMVIDGEVGLGTQTYDLLLRLSPLQTIDKIVSSVPLVGYLLTGRDRILTALAYHVTGPWSDPQVTGLSEEEEDRGVEGFFQRLKEMQWKDLLPWR